ncbi:hypothetical protein KIH39_24410 [Telmatocola sphagniphila]|uniref:Uncharacterized protein n=1 Tax=Telmatocola sphagniphila TaxID=1123043 RepID=A0A8E6EUZ6_9BACT|nr:hypothetical protein [Telmatocola sphagniphila]QVL31942.1 hypothetical protein KIH39_24410 [Telmatocola sphagniphila]
MDRIRPTQLPTPAQVSTPAATTPATALQTSSIPNGSTPTPASGPFVGMPGITQQTAVPSLPETDRTAPAPKTDAAVEQTQYQQPPMLPKLPVVENTPKPLPVPAPNEELPATLPNESLPALPNVVAPDWDVLNSKLGNPSPKIEEKPTNKVIPIGDVTPTEPTPEIKDHQTRSPAELGDPFPLGKTKPILPKEENPTPEKKVDPPHSVSQVEPPVRPIPAPKEELPVSPPKVDLEKVRSEKPPMVVVPVPEAPQSPMDSPLIVALRCMQQNRNTEVFEALKNYDSGTQEMLSNLMHPILRISEVGMRNLSAEEANIVLDRLEIAADQVRSKAAFTAGRICYVEKASRYGNYIKDLRPAFQPNTYVDVYIEIRNFSTEIRKLTGNRSYEAPENGYYVRLSSHWELRDAADKVVSTDADSPGEVFTEFIREYRSLPRDMYFVNRVIVPRNIHPGVYTLWIYVTDIPTGRTLRRPLEFRVAGKY